MHVCNVISEPFPPREGIGHYVYGLSTRLIEKGHKVTIITRGYRNKTQREVIDGIEVIRPPFIPFYPFYIHLHGIFVKKVFKSLESQVDIVHVHTPLPPLIKTSLPIITTVHSPMLTNNRYVKVSSIYSLFSKISARFVSYPLELKHIQASDIVMTVSKSIAQELGEYHLNPDEVIVVGNGIDEKFFFPKQKRSRNDNKYIMFAGRMDREKGLFDLVDCGRYICSERSDIFFIFAGSGRDLNKLRQKTRKAGLQDRFIFLGQVDKDQLVKLYQNTTLFVLPSYHEGLPTALLEAMSCGLPVLATDVRGNRDIISAGENGILVPPRAPRKMAEATSMLLEDEKLRKILSKNARKTIERNYTWDVVSNKILRCYDSLVGV
jgi:glycosyltransferase involved in cell wall biosynthesis